MNTLIDHRTDASSDDFEIHFDSVQDWADFAKDISDAVELNGTIENMDERDAINMAEHMTQDNSGCSFSNYKNGLQARAMILDRACDTSIQSRVHKQSTNLPPLATEQGQFEQSALYNDESGLMLDSTAYFSGEENCMVNFDIQPVTRPVIWIACNIGATAGVNLEQFINRGSSLIASVHALERAQVSVGIIGYSNASGYGFDNAVQTMVVKKPEQALDESTLINLFADCSAFRTMAFTIRNFITKTDNCGATRPIKKKHFKLSYASEHNLVVLPYKDMDVYNDASDALSFTIEQIKAQANINL